MTTTFDISSKDVRRTFKERLSDFHRASLAGGLLNLLAFIVLLVPLLILAIGEEITKALLVRQKKTAEKKEFLLDLPKIKIKAFDFYTSKYYDKLKAKYNYSDNDLRDIDNMYFLESYPAFDFFSEKLFTNTLTDFSNGIIVQEIDFEKTPCTSKIIYFDLISSKTVVLKELQYIYELNFEKNNDKELKILLRFPGDKQILTVKRKDN